MFRAVILSALYLNEKVDAANARLLKQANDCIELTGKEGTQPIAPPEQPGIAPWNFFSVTDYVRISSHSRVIETSRYQLPPQAIPLRYRASPAAEPFVIRNRVLGNSKRPDLETKPASGSPPTPPWSTTPTAPPTASLAAPSRIRA